MGNEKDGAVRVVDEGSEGGENKCGMCVRARVCGCRKRKGIEKQRQGKHEEGRRKELRECSSVCVGSRGVN